MRTAKKHTADLPRLELAWQLVEQKRFCEALELIKTASNEDRAQLSPLSAAKLYYLWSRSLHQLGAYKSALLKAKVAQRLVGDLPEHRLFAEIKFAYAKTLVQLGRLSDALEEFNESYVYYRRVGDTAAMLFPLDGIAQIHYIAGDLKRCREVLSQCLEVARKYHSSERIERARRNLARILFQMGEFADCRRLLPSLECKPIGGAHSYWVLLHGLDAALAKNHVRAAEVLKRALKSFSTVSAARDEIVCLEYLGLNEYYAGKYDEAKAYYDDILGRKEITASARAQTLRMLTDVYVAKAMWPEANETAALAEAAITRINERIELGALDRARGLIAANAGDHDQARDHFDKSIRLLREIGARYELALSYLTCGRCEIFSQDERRYFLRRAHDLFAEMEVAKRVAEVEEEIGRVGPRLRGDDNTRGRGGDDCKGRGDDKRQLTLKSPAPSSGGQVVIADSPCMRELMQTITRLASTDLTVLLVGETGTGKDLLAQYIHSHSGRSGEFVTVNSAAIPNEMVEAELFGYARGAFTGANKDKPGLFELADGGTFYLNEISSCTPEFQAKLLEVLESGMIRRLGETSKRRVDFRLIAASNQDLNRLIREERFRPDLFYRLREYQIALPPLQERREDFPALIHHFLLEAGCPQDGVVLKSRCDQIAAQFAGRPWPGNVRMLRAELRRLWFACDGDLDRLQRLASNRDEQSQREELIYALRECDYNQSEAARRLGVSEGTVRNRIKRFHITRQG